MRFSNSGFSSEEWLSSTSGQSFNSDPHEDKTGDIYIASHGKTLNDSKFSAVEGSAQVENPFASASASSFTCTSAFATASVALYQSLISGFSSLNDYLWRAPTLGLRLTKSPSPATNHNTQPIIQSAEEYREIKKAVHIPISVLEIGKFRVMSKHEGNLVARCYYEKRKLMWEILKGNLKSKIEFNWEDILSLGAKIEPNKPGILMIELKELPSFYHEKDPQPRKHANWEQSGDFTRNQASTNRVHVLQFSPGLLDAFYQKLIESEDRLKQLSQGPCPTLHHPYFTSNAYDAHGSLTCPPAPLPPTTYQLGNHIQSSNLVQVMDNSLPLLRGVVNSQRVEDPATLFTRLPDPHFSSYGYYDANGSLSNSYLPTTGYGALQVMGDIIPPLHEGIYRDPNLVVSSDFATSSRLPSQDWLNHGGDLFNRRYANEEVKISPAEAPNLRLKWKFNAGKDISATPAIFDDTLYFPSWNGYIYAVKKSDGSLVWKQNVQQLTGLNASVQILNVNATVSRNTPTLLANGALLVYGTYGPAVVYAVKRTTGQLFWMTKLDDHPSAVITMSGTYYDRAFYIGVSSLENIGRTQCCTFRGSFLKLNALTGAILWKTYMLPDNFGQRGEYAGASLWGSSPSIDVIRNHVYIGTGNLYSAPSHIIECQQRENNRTTPDPDACIEPENHSNSLLALDLRSGEIRWFHQLGGYDLFTFACLSLPNPDCPPGPNLDADFSEAPMMLTLKFVNGSTKDVVVAGQKSGVIWALARDGGHIIWATQAGPGGLAGGAYWGAATDEQRVYTNIANSERKTFTLKPSNMTTTAGGWVGMQANNGKILWSTANPSNATSDGPVSVANGVVFAGSANSNGSIYAINAMTGKILWSYETGATVFGGISISDGCIYVGHGYRVNLGVLLNYTAGTDIFAFCIRY
ncbi:hypothetical protein L6164_006573 [Bauhinia variegata]|uniref:Uncharacterized protein n=1 Tax=Bauhinia variegata TaxID=167791 RepID=A0ACB9PWQ0_BAUVA|nr:hypothetical protein L6164_006573 [Bauhinia variegata]